MSQHYPEKDVLEAYAAGELGWRDACKKLNLISWDELKALLEQHDIAEPKETPLSDEKAEEFAKYVTGKEPS